MNERSQTDFERLDSMSEEDIERNAREDPDAHPTDAAYWEGASLVNDTEQKQPITIRITPRVLEWFKRGGDGYQTRINRVLEAYIDRQEARQGGPKEAGPTP